MVNGVQIVADRISKLEAMPFKFESLRVWQRAIELSLEIHQLTRSFPTEEKYILSAQIKRAADSISLNIAEGSGGQSNKEFARFIGMANRSALEVVSCLFIAKKRAIIEERDFMRMYDELTQITKMLQALRNALKK